MLKNNFTLKLSFDIRVLQVPSSHPRVHFYSQEEIQRKRESILGRVSWIESEIKIHVQDYWVVHLGLPW